MVYVSVTGAIVLELLCNIFLLNGLLGKEKKIPIVWAVIYVFVTTVYIMVVPDGWTNTCYVFTLLYVILGYHVSWKDSLITVVVSL